MRTRRSTGSALLGRAQGGTRIERQDTGARVKRRGPSERERPLPRAMPRRDPGNERHVEREQVIADDGVDVAVSGERASRRWDVEPPENDRTCAGERLRRAEVLEQPVDPVGLFAGFFEEDDGAPQVRP